jgi:hypothetical protein
VLGQLRAEGYPVRGEDLARLSPFVRRHLGVHGRYWFALPGLAGGIRLLRDPDAEDDDREWLRGAVPVNSHAPRRLPHAAEVSPLNGFAGVAFDHFW